VRRLAAILLLAVAGCGEEGAGTLQPLPGERHFRSIRQLTNGGENAEAYWSCSYFLRGDGRILYSSTHGGGDAPPAPPDMSRGYVWAVYSTYDIYVANADGSEPRNLTNSPGYDAEATVSPKGDRIVFTSSRDGDIDLYSMNLDGSDVKRLTDRVGYDGGAFFSWDGTRIVWRAPGEGDEPKDFKELLAQGLVRPTRLELWVMDADGSGKRQVTRNGKANFAPCTTRRGATSTSTSSAPTVPARSA
jgi:Tol biopolymer transport system component